jgi:integrase
MKKDLVPVSNPGAVTIRRPFTPAQFGDLAELPPELEWLANLTNPKTRRAYKIDVEEFIAFAGLGELRAVTRAHVIAWRKDLEKRELAHSSIRRKLSALSALFDYLCEHNAVAGNPVDGVKRPMANGNEGSTPALGDAQARQLLEASPADTLKVCAIAPSWLPCAITASAVQNHDSRCNRGRQSRIFPTRAVPRCHRAAISAIK